MKERPIASYGFVDWAGHGVLVQLPLHHHISQQHGFSTGWFSVSFIVWF